MPSNNPPKENPDLLNPVKKPSLILVHGFRGSPVGLADVANNLRTYGYQVHTPAIPPFGGAPSLSQYTPQQYAKFLADYISIQGLERPVLIGHSMGSIVVSAALEAYPKIVNSKAILLSPISNRTAPPFRLVAPLSAILPARMIDYITTQYLIASSYRSNLREILVVTHQCSTDHNPRKREVLKAASFSTRYAITDFNIRQQLLILAGEQDHLIKQKHTKQAAAKLQATLEFLPNTGHLHNYEQPRETADAIIKFLNN